MTLTDFDIFTPRQFPAEVLPKILLVFSAILAPDIDFQDQLDDYSHHACRCVRKLLLRLQTLNETHLFIPGSFYFCKYLYIC